MAARLTKDDKKRLHGFVDKNIFDPAMAEAVKAAEELLSVAADEYINLLYPQNEMAILDKYEKASHFKTLYIMEMHEEYKDWKKKFPIPRTEEKPGPLVPKGDDIFFKGQPGDILYDYFFQWKDMVEKKEKADDSVQDAYRALIRKTQSVEALVEIWPEAQKVLSRKTQTELDTDEAAKAIKMNMCARGVAPQEECQDNWPKTLKEAVDRLIIEIPAEDLKVIQDCPKHDLAQYHGTLGRTIRNTFGLWTGNTDLMISCLGKIGHADDASMVIVSTLWDELNKHMQK